MQPGKLLSPGYKFKIIFSVAFLVIRIDAFDTEVDVATAAQVLPWAEFKRDMPESSAIPKLSLKVLRFVVYG